MDKYQYSANALNEEIFDFIYSAALHDAVLQKAFKGERKWIQKLSKPKEIVKGYIIAVLESNFSNQEAHDIVFLQTANQLCKTISASDQRPEGCRDFSFGNAQKLINIAVKYTYLRCWENAAMRKKFQYCHCPVDSIMLGRVWKQCKHVPSIELGEQNAFYKAWGSEGLSDGKTQQELENFPERYTLFQGIVRELIKHHHGTIYPIEFDYIFWKPSEQDKGK